MKIEVRKIDLFPFLIGKVLTKFNKTIAGKLLTVSIPYR